MKTKKFEYTKQDLIDYALNNLNDPEVFDPLAENSIKQGMNPKEIKFMRGLFVDKKADFYLFRFNEGIIALTKDEDGVTKPYLLLDEEDGLEFVKDNNLLFKGTLEHHVLSYSEFKNLYMSCDQIVKDFFSPQA